MNKQAQYQFNQREIMAKVLPQDGPMNVSTQISVPDHSKLTPNTEKLPSNNTSHSPLFMAGLINGESPQKVQFSRLATQSPSYEHSSLKCVFFFSLYYVVLFAWLLGVSASSYVEHRSQIQAIPFWVITFLQFFALFTSMSFLFICRKSHVGFGIWGQLLTMIVFEICGLIKETNSMRKANTLGLVALVCFLQSIVLLLQLMVHRKRKNELILKRILRRCETAVMNKKHQDISLEERISEKQEKDEVTKEIEMFEEEQLKIQNSQDASFKILNNSSNQRQMGNSIPKMRKSDKDVRRSKQFSNSQKRDKPLSLTPNSSRYNLDEDSYNLNTDNMDEKSNSPNNSKITGSYFNL